MSGNDGNKEREVEIFNRFSRIVKEKFSSLADERDGGAKINHLDELYKRPEFASEKRILNDMNSMGLRKGVMCGLATFAFLRIGPGAMSRMIMRRTSAAMGSGGASPFNRTSGNTFDQPAGGQQNVPPGILFRLVKLSVDTFISVSVGAYASLFFVDKDKMMEQFAEIPLIEGRSLLSEELCGDFMSEFRKFDRQTWDDNHKALDGGSRGSYATNTDDGQSDFRDTIQGFVANCRRREIYEDELRKERGMGDHEPVVIPSGGVPRDIAVSLEDLLGAKEFGNDSVQDGDDYFDTYFDMGDDGKED